MSLVVEKALKAVDDANKAVPPSAEVQAEATAKGDDASIPKNVRPTKAKAKAAAKAKPAAAKARAAGNGAGPMKRVTDEWIGKDKKDVAVKDHVAHGEFVGTVKGRWTKRKKDGVLIPMVTLILDKPKGKRHNAPAAECTHVK